MVTGEYAMMLEFHTTRTFAVGGGDNDRMHFSNVDGSDGGRAPDPDNDGSNTGKYEGRKKIRPSTSVGTRTTSKGTIP